MTLLEAITRITFALRGTDEDAPAIGTDEANYWISLLNRKKDELFEDIGRQWSFAYKKSAPYEPGTVETSGTSVTGTGTYFADYNPGDEITVQGTTRVIDTIASDTSLSVTVAFDGESGNFTRTTIIDDAIEEYSTHRSLLAPSDRVFVRTPDNTFYLDLIKPQEQNYSTQQVYLSDGNPQLLSFSKDIESTDPMVGGGLIIPGYYMPGDVASTTDVIPVPDPNWLVLATAAEIAFGDIVYEDRAETLNTRANALWQQMVIKNRRGTFGNPRRTPYNVKRIRDTRVG